MLLQGPISRRMSALISAASLAAAGLIFTTPAAHAAQAEQAEVTVSQTTVSAKGVTTVTIEGTGFDPSLATGTRPPLAGLPSGAYVVFGKFADDWKPSADAPSDNRKILSQKWALPAASKAIVDAMQPGASVLLAPDGSFAAELTIDKSAIDAIATSPNLTNYGIYTYAGGGPKVAEYETYTPITFTKVDSVTNLTSAKSAYGNAATITATVRDADGDAAEGTVTLNGAGNPTATLMNGKATFKLPTALPVGTQTLTAAYSGNDSTNASTSPAASLQIVKAGVKTKFNLKKKPTTKKKGKAIVKVNSKTGAKATGKVRVFLKKGKATKKVTAKINKKGKAKVKLPKLKKGKWQVRVKYLATPTHKATKKAKKGKIKIKK